MQTWVALLRGINVGGRNKMPMAELSSLLESLGCRSVRTYIQSGNVVFDSSVRSRANLSKRLSDALDTQFKFRPPVLLLTEAAFRTAVKKNPFVDAISEPKTLHFFFLESPPESPDLDGIASLASSTEQYKLIDDVFYLHTPDGFARSKLASRAEGKLGVTATARNYATVQNLISMLDGG
jgi:uncharacterized protein (DUF1697 family)